MHPTTLAASEWFPAVRNRSPTLRYRSGLLKPHASGPDAPRRSRIPRSNILLSALAAGWPERFAEIEPLLESMTIESGTELVSLEQTPPAVYFVDAGLVSLVSHTPGGDSLEIGTIGVDGVTSISWLLGGAIPAFSYVAPLRVRCRRLDGAEARRLLQRDAHVPFRRLISAYGQQMMGQLGQSVICARFHTATERVARLLLLTSSRLDTDIIPLTHESLASMVGASRSLVTESLGQLKRTACIDVSRGRIAVLDGDRLTEQACECFDLEEARVARFLRRVMPEGS